MFKNLRKIVMVGVALMGAVVAHGATTRYVELRSTLQPNTTGLNAIFVSSGTILNFRASTGTINGPLTVTGLSTLASVSLTTISGTINDVSITTHSGGHTFSSATITAASIGTLSGVMTDNSTGTHSGAHTFNGGLTSSTSTLTLSTLASSTTIKGPILDKNLSAGTTFDYLNSQSSGTTAAPQWSHLGLILQTQSLLTTAVSSATTASSFVKTGVLVTITPKFANSKIRISWSGDIRSSNVAGDFPFVTLERNASNLASGGGSNYMAGFSASTVTGTLQVPASFVYLDSPNSTSALTYEIYLRTSTGGATATVCAGTSCQLVVEEIGQ